MLIYTQPYSISQDDGIITSKLGLTDGTPGWGAQLQTITTGGLPDGTPGWSAPLQVITSDGMNDNTQGYSTAIYTLGNTVVDGTQGYSIVR